MIYYRLILICITITFFNCTGEPVQAEHGKKLDVRGSKLKYNSKAKAHQKPIINTKVDDEIKATKPLQIKIPSHLVYSWSPKYSAEDALINRVLAPEYFKRIPVKKGSFGEWLRFLPLFEEGRSVRLFNGDLKGNQSAHSSIIKMDVGDRDLQQCADALMRLKSEYHYGQKQYSNIHFNYTSGDLVSFDDWRYGRKPIVKGNKVLFTKKVTEPDNSYSNFKKYLIAIFNYAGTSSLSKEMKSVAIEDMEIGDVFIQGGFPGHGIMVVDMVENKKGKKSFILAQSYMPAQEMHILKNPQDIKLSPWYSVDFGETLETPEWLFSRNDLKRFSDI